VVVDQVDLVPAVAPVVAAPADVEGEGSEGGSDEVLEDRAELDGVIARGEAALEDGVPDGAGDDERPAEACGGVASASTGFRR